MTCIREIRCNTIRKQYNKFIGCLSYYAVCNKKRDGVGFEIPEQYQHHHAVKNERYYLVMSITDNKLQLDVMRLITGRTYIIPYNSILIKIRRRMTMHRKTKKQIHRRSFFYYMVTFYNIRHQEVHELFTTKLPRNDNNWRLRCKELIQKCGIIVPNIH